jgi:succinate dehydrogenase/fumarate reductase cytochrome b subunit
MARSRRADERHILRGIRTSTANNAPAYGFSLATAGSYAALTKVRGEPTWPELFLFLAAACAGFAIVNGLSTWFFRKESPDEPELVISLATSLSVFSVCGSAGAAAGIAFALSGWLAWPLASLTFTLVYIVGVGAEIGLAAHQHPHGGAEAERRRQSEAGSST